MLHLRLRVGERARKKGGKGASVFLCGDFNGFPGYCDDGIGHDGNDNGDFYNDNDYGGCCGYDGDDDCEIPAYAFGVILNSFLPSGDAADGVAALKAAGFASA